MYSNKYNRLISKLVLLRINFSDRGLLLQVYNILYFLVLLVMVRVSVPVKVGVMTCISHVNRYIIFENVD
jgi:hypothetical protein